MGTASSVSVASLLRDQLRVLELVGSDIRLAPDRKRRVLLVTEEDWTGWSAFMQGGPLPAHPVAPVMLQRVAALTYRLAALADRQPACG
jgi:hypothetical protein